MSDIWNKENCLDFCVDPLVHSFGNKKLFIFLFIRYIPIPKDFLYWKVKNFVGWSVAHEAVRLKKLPKDFKFWNIKDCTGWSVAHEAAVYGKLPENFNKWDIRDKNGWSVAHIAARWGNLPNNFDRWDISLDGWTAADEYNAWKNCTAVDW